ncbi:serine/threonine protein kinase [Limnohabitans sp. 2KL-17]|uniref:serine/threonine protein kinase n=1 Tax=Limnohabitans sp. 2KL-17 TaxID=1100704 RepID=UPI000D37D065|nr:bifunctional serine/threonine-protein kinase/universal stress protein [Limnohabitans sp. 2KL-17]PUE51517.1 serine/threonine protein kinase [Limnohabitans sp. 2KL-17]
MKLLNPGHLIDGFEVEACLHAGGMAHIYKVVYAPSDDGTRRAAEFPLAMKIPRMTASDGAENIVSFEVELQILADLKGPHVPRFVAAGDLSRVPYLVMEYIEGKTLQHWLDHRESLTVPELAALGAAMARAVHSLHQQNVCHLDLKPANVLIRPNGSAVLLDFGLSCHAQYPDLLAEELRKAVGSPVWISPEQVVGVRGDPRSDIFAIGVMLYELATGELPFGQPATAAGMRQRLWMDPPPPRKYRPDLPEWLQEVILRCLEPVAADRYPSASHLAFDLTHPDQVKVTERGKKTKGTGFWTHFKRWVRASGMAYSPSPLPAHQIEQVPIIMVAVPHQDVSDATLYSLRQAVARSLGIRPGARLACVTVISSGLTSSTEADKCETQVHQWHLSRLQQWAQPLDLVGHQISFHVIESGDVADALLRYAQGNQVNMLILGAATHGLQMQRVLATVPIKVAMQAPCTVILVKQSLPFERLAEIAA